MKKLIEVAKNRVKAFVWERCQKKVKQKEQVNSKEAQVKELLQSLYVVMSIVDDLLKKKEYGRSARKHFWEDFRKGQNFRQEVFKELIESENVDELLQKRKSRVCIERRPADMVKIREKGKKNLTEVRKKQTEKKQLQEDKNAKAK